MAYGNEYSDQPFELASKTSHTNIINDNEVQKFLKKCKIQPFLDDDDKNVNPCTLVPPKKNPITNIIAIDGAYTDVFVKEDYPSSTIAFFQFGALFFKHQDLVSLHEKPFIDPDDFSKLQNMEKLKLVIPTKGVTLESESDLISSVRKAIYDFFVTQDFMQTLKWLIFEEFDPPSIQYTWELAHCPHCNKMVSMKKSDVLSDYTIQCPHCGEKIYLTDVFRLHEIMDNELGAGGILGYLVTAIEQIIVAFLIKQFLAIRPSILENTLFVKDGPLAFFGQTANLHKPMRSLITFLTKNYNIYLVGLEKSGSFVDHAAQISKNLMPNQILLLGNEYIYKYIIPGHAKNNAPYGSSSYYGNKVIFKSKYNHTYVATIPSLMPKLEPQIEDLINIDVILENISELKCNLYYNSLVPVVLANKLISIAGHPSSDLLKTFAQENIII